MAMVQRGFIRVLGATTRATDLHFTAQNCALSNAVMVTKCFRTDFPFPQSAPHDAHGRNSEFEAKRALHYVVSEAVDCVIVHDSDRLHEGVAYC